MTEVESYNNEASDDSILEVLKLMHGILANTAYNSKETVATANRILRLLPRLTNEHEIMQQYTQLINSIFDDAFTINGFVD